jgi:hypothetical protein
LRLIVPNGHDATVQASQHPWLGGVKVDTLDAVRMRSQKSL